MAQVVQVQRSGAGRLELRTRIVDAAARLLREQGPAAVTTRGVAEAAAVQAPAIYRLFGDKDGLLDAVAEHELARYVSGKASSQDSGDPLTDLRAAWDSHIAFGLDNPALFVLLADPGRGARSPAAAAGQDVLRARVHRLAAAGRLRVPERRAVEMVHAAGTGSLLALLASAPEDRDRELADAMFDAVMRTVLVDAAPMSTGTADGADGAAMAAMAATAAVTLRAAVPALPRLTATEQALLVEWLDRLAAP